MPKLQLAILNTALYVSLGLSACKDSASSTSDRDSKVFKYSGSVQCQVDSGIPLDQMQMELTDTGIDVVCAQTATDGMGYPAVCGASTGEINIYQIRTVNIEEAEKLGFSSVIVLPDYRDQPCFN